MAALTWNDCLADLASTWANGCVYQHGQPNLAIQNPFPGTGQNIFAALNSAVTPTLNFTEAILDWFAEKQAYTFSTGACAINDCGHYTQIVWGNSSLIGCGYSACNPLQNTGLTGYPFAIYLVCNYWAPGNIAGQQLYTPGTACATCPSYSTGCSGGLCVVPPIPDTCTTAIAGTVAPGGVTVPTVPIASVGVLVTESSTTTSTTTTNSQSTSVSSSSSVFGSLSVAVGGAVIAGAFLACCLLGVLIGRCCVSTLGGGATPSAGRIAPGQTVPYTTMY